MGKRLTVLVALLALVLLAAPGCVNKKNYAEGMDGVDSRVNAVESAVEANERSISDLRKSTDDKIGSVENQARAAQSRSDEAMSKATAAEQAAKGRLLWDVTLTNDKVSFEFGKAALSPEAIRELDSLVSRVKKYGKALYLEIEGHTDNIGTEMLNEKLGVLRAAAVRNYLNEKGGLPLHAMNMISFGESRPIADNSSSDGREQNRRVVIRVLE